MEPEGSWLTSPEAIRERLCEIARQTVSYAVALQVSGLFRQRMGNLALMPNDCHGRSKEELIASMLGQTSDERRRMAMAIAEEDIRQFISDRFQSLEDSLQSGNILWKRLIPGRQILNIFAAQARIPLGRLKMLFIGEAEKDDFATFSEVVEIFAHFSSFTH